MQLFDKVDPQKLDRRHWQLSMLSLGMIVVLGAGVALLMYPAVFGSNAASGGSPFRALFFGFCALCALVVAYLLNRQYVVRQLRRNLFQQKKEIAQLRQEASADLLGTLPGFGHFQDRLTMGFRRAAQTGEPLSLLLVRVKPSPMFDSTSEVSVALGDAAKVLLGKLRGDDSLYLLASGVFAIVLPNTGGPDADRISSRVAEGLADASGASNRFSLDLEAVKYPEQASTAYEIEKRAAAFSGQGSPAPSSD
jgi:GGDEF domain-containing protein